MAKTKSDTRTKSKSRTSLRDIKPKASNKQSFTIHQLKPEDMPSVEPLLEDASAELDVEVRKIENEVRRELGPPKMHVTHVSATEELEEEPYMRPLDIEELVPKDTIKVKFGKFVQLVANHDFSEVIEAHAEDEIIMTSNLLTELAGAHDKREERKIPLVFLVGIAIGIVLTYIFFSQ